MKIIDLFKNPSIIGVVGDVNCLPKGTLVKTPTGLKEIEKVKEVLSYNFEKKKMEVKKVKIYPSGKKKVFLIKTKVGVLRCSPEHKWFVKRNGKVVVLPAKDLNKSDVLLRYNMENKICLECGKGFYVKPSALKTAKYCSRRCLGKNSQLVKNQNFEKNHTWLNNVITKKELVELYNDKKLSVNAISILKKVSPNVVYRRMKLYNIKRRDFYEQKKIDSEMGRVKEYHKHLIIQGSKKRNRKDYLRIAKQNKKWICEKCGKKKTNDNFDLIVHHIDGNNKNNDINNLMVLCQSCHSYIHRKGIKNERN